jgi:type III restriction enzyme
MKHFEPKSYQQDVLNSTRLYFERIHELGKANTAFTVVTDELWDNGLPYRGIEGFEPDMPYFCLRIPTGGGKTYVAAKSVAVVNTVLLRQEHSVILWLVPSKAIRDQTLRALKTLDHPYHAALKEAGPVSVYDLDEAKSITRSTMDTSTVVIVATRQAFQVGDKELRKVYESSGELMPHFSDLNQRQKANLLSEEVEGATIYPRSFANVMRFRRPFVIVDEAHNSRTELSFDTLARFRPSGIMELTATPDMVKSPSNVLHSVSAAELKAMGMIKLPIQLETEPNWQQCLNDAIDCRNQLDAIAREEERAGSNYLRPIVLIQAEKRRQGLDTLDVERVKAELVNNQNIPEEEIVIATGDQKGLEQIDQDFATGILSPDCPVKFVLTQQALAEGWDCPFAYILVSMAEVRAATSVEQLLGRILRQPGAARRKNPALNQSYAYVVSRDFTATAQSLRDRLVQDAGFDAKEADAFVTARKREQQKLDIHRQSNRIVITPVDVLLSEKPDLKKVGKDLKEKLTWNAKAKTLTIERPLTEDEVKILEDSVVWEDSKAAIAKGGEVSR